MEEIILEIMSEEYREEYREKYSELIGIFGEFRILFCEFWYEMHTCSPARGMGPTHAAAAPEPPASSSAGLFGRTTVPIPLKDWLHARLLA